METSKSLDLIRGCFEPADAREIVLTLLSDKMKFHNLRNLSSQERFGTPDSSAIGKLEHLKAAKREAELFFSEAIAGGNRITINSTISMQIE